MKQANRGLRKKWFINFKAVIFKIFGQTIDKALQNLAGVKTAIYKNSFARVQRRRLADLCSHGLNGGMNRLRSPGISLSTQKSLRGATHPRTAGRQASISLP